MHRFLAVLVVLLQAGYALGADCAGGSVRSLRASPARVAFTGTVTRAGLTHPAAVAGGLNWYSKTRVPRRGVSHHVAGRALRHAPGRHDLRRRGDVRRQRAAARHPPAGRHRTRDAARHPSHLQRTARDRPLRARFTVGSGCARTCVAVHADGGDAPLQPSVGYAPFADEGFGASSRRAAGRATSRSAASRSTPRSRCDFLIEERCLLPYPSSVFLEDRSRRRRPGSASTTAPQAAAGEHQRRAHRPDRLEHARRLQPGPDDPGALPRHGFPVDLGRARTSPSTPTSPARSTPTIRPCS